MRNLNDCSVTWMGLYGLLCYVILLFLAFLIIVRVISKVSTILQTKYKDYTWGSNKYYGLLLYSFGCALFGAAVAACTHIVSWGTGYSNRIPSPFDYVMYVILTPIAGIFMLPFVGMWRCGQYV